MISPNKRTHIPVVRAFVIGDTPVQRRKPADRMVRWAITATPTSASVQRRPGDHTSSQKRALAFQTPSPGLLLTKHLRPSDSNNAR